MFLYLESETIPQPLIAHMVPSAGAKLESVGNPIGLTLSLNIMDSSSSMRTRSLSIDPDVRSGTSSRCPFSSVGQIKSLTFIVWPCSGNNFDITLTSKLSKHFELHHWGRDTLQHWLWLLKGWNKNDLVYCREFCRWFACLETIAHLAEVMITFSLTMAPPQKWVLIPTTKYLCWIDTWSQ